MIEEEKKQKAREWMRDVSHVIVLCSPVIVWVWSNWWDNKFNEMEKAFSEKFMTKEEAVFFYDRRKETMATMGQFTKLNGIVQTHQADSGQHYPKESVVSVERFEAQIAVTQGILNQVNAKLTELKIDDKEFKQEIRQFVSDYYKERR